MCGGRGDEGKLAGIAPMFASSVFWVAGYHGVGSKDVPTGQCKLALFTHKTALVLHLISGLQRAFRLSASHV